MFHHAIYYSHVCLCSPCLVMSVNCTRDRLILFPMITCQYSCILVLCSSPHHFHDSTTFQLLLFSISLQLNKHKSRGSIYTTTEFKVRSFGNHEVLLLIRCSLKLTKIKEISSDAHQFHGYTTVTRFSIIRICDTVVRQKRKKLNSKKN